MVSGRSDVFDCTRSSFQTVFRHSGIRGCEMIFHAGDIGSRKILDRIAEIAPVSAVRGNADQNIDLDLPEQLIVNIHGVRVFMTHKKKDVPQELCETDLVIFGHSHRYEVSELNGVCYLNPGSCGPRRFHQPITMALLRISEDGAFTIEKLDIPHQEGVRKSEAQDEALLREDPGKLVKRVVSEVNRGKSVQQIAVKLHVSEELAETISRMYLTHPGVTTEGILQRIQEFLITAKYVCLMLCDELSTDYEIEFYEQM